MVKNSESKPDIHALGLKSNNDAVWSFGGNNPNGSGSIWIHLNN